MIVALHGFLGLAQDWQALEIPGHKLQPKEFWQDAGCTFDQWAERFVSSIPKSFDKPALMGYSLGGRLAMHAAIRDPARFRAAIFVSAHPGLTTAIDRLTRAVSDRVWAERFRREPWADLQKAWNSQPVLKRPAAARDAIDLPRLEDAFSREQLAASLETWGLGEQADLRLQLAALKIPVLYVTGSEDGKFTAVTREFAREGQHSVLANAGHRVPWDQPRVFGDTVAAFMRGL